MQNAQHMASSNSHSHSHALSDDSLSSSRPRPIAPMPLPLPAQKQRPYHVPHPRGVGAHGTQGTATPESNLAPGTATNAAGNAHGNGNGNSNGSILKPKQKRYRANPDQLRHLINLFNINPSPTASELTNLSVRINMPTQSVILWFKNRRARVPHKKAEKERRAAVAKAEKVSAASTVAAAATAFANISMPAPAPKPVSGPITINSDSYSNSNANGNFSTNSAVDTAAAIVLADMASSHHKNSNMPRDLAMLCSAAAVQQSQQHSTTGRSYLPPLPPPLPPININVNGSGNGNGNGNSEAKRNRAIPASPQYPVVPALPGGIRLTVPANYYTNSNIISNTGTTRSSLLPTPPPPSSESASASISAPQIAAHTHATTTPRRPRGAHYSPGENVEVLINCNLNPNGTDMYNDDKNRFWMPAIIVNKCAGSDPKELQLGASVVNHSDRADNNNVEAAQAVTAVSSASSSDGERDGEDSDDRNSNTESPRTVQSPAASTRKHNARKYVVKFGYESKNVKVEEMSCGRIRPVPPMIEWNHLQPGDAVEVEINGGWKVGTMKEYNSTKNKWGVLVDGIGIEWMRKDQLRAYQVWRGGNEWVQKVKIPPTRRIAEDTKEGMNDDGKDTNNKENILLLGKRTPVNANNGKTEGMETRRKRFRKK